MEWNFPLWNPVGTQDTLEFEGFWLPGAQSVFAVVALLSTHQGDTPSGSSSGFSLTIVLVSNVQQMAIFQFHLL